MKEKFRREQKGITLIALVITIIVLLVLAGVVISMLSGEDGIIARAQAAKKAYEDAETQEQKGLEEYELKIYENTKLNNLINAGYIASSVNGKVYLTGIDSSEKRKISKVMALGYKVYTSNNELQETGNLKTGNIIKDENGKELATVVWFGDANVSGSLDSSDPTYISTYINTKPAYMSEAQIYSMDINHDGIISFYDERLFYEMFTGEWQTFQNAKVKEINTNIEIVALTAEEAIEGLEIAEEVVIEEDPDLGGEVCIVTLNGTYTYKDIVEKIEGNLLEGKVKSITGTTQTGDYIEKSLDSEETVQSGDYIELSDLILERTSEQIKEYIDEDSMFYLKIK